MFASLGESPTKPFAGAPMSADGTRGLVDQLLQTLKSIDPSRGDRLDDRPEIEASTTNHLLTRLGS